MPAGTPSRNPWVAALVVAAVGCLALGGLFALRPGTAPARKPVPLLATLADVVLTAPLPEGAATTLRGAGPWRVTVQLPSGAADGGYNAQLVDGEGYSLGVVDPGPTAADGAVVLLLRELPGNGRYRLVLGSAGTPEHGPWTYALEAREIP